MSHRVARRLASLGAIAALVAPARALHAQRCIGTTAYVVRDEAGAILGAEQMQRLTIASLNGVALDLRADTVDGAPPYYAFDDFTRSLTKREPERVTTANNPLVFSALNPLAPCGEVRDLTLAHAGRTMRLLLDVGEHNTYYEIDGPPFQEGTFVLRSLRCRDGARPPMIDNDTRGKCLVSADAWGRTEAPVGHLVARQLAAGIVGSSAESCRSPAGGLLDAITTQRDWNAAWTSHPGVARGGPLPRVDFASQLVLVVYRPNGPRAARVDERGDVTSTRPLGLRGPIECIVLYEAVDRDGVRSIDGRPLPGARAR